MLHPTPLLPPGPASRPLAGLAERSCRWGHIQGLLTKQKAEKKSSSTHKLRRQGEGNYHNSNIKPAAPGRRLRRMGAPPPKESPSTHSCSFCSLHSQVLLAKDYTSTDPWGVEHASWAAQVKLLRTISHLEGF